MPRPRRSGGRRRRRMSRGTRSRERAPGISRRSPRTTAARYSSISVSESPSSRTRYGCAQKQPWRTPMPNSALSRAATSEWCTPSTVNVATGNVDCSGAGPEHTHSRYRGEPGPKPTCQRRGRDRSISDHPMTSSSSIAACRRDRAEHVGGAGLLPLGRIRPDHFVEVDEIDGTAARPGRGHRRRRPLEGPRAAPAPNGAYILWPLQATKSTLAGSRRCGASWAASRNDGYVPLGARRRRSLRSGASIR